MIRIDKSVLFVMAAALGVWGCSKSSPGEAHEGAHARALEAKIAKLEEDVQAMQAARDHLRLKLDRLEKETAQANRQIQALLHERNDLRQQVTARTSERDVVQAQYETFRKEIRNLLGQAESAAAQPPVQPVTAATSAPAPGKS